MPLPPSTVGYKLTRAREVLAEDNWEIAVVEQTDPPARHSRPNGPLRIVRQRQIKPGQMVLTVTVAQQISINNR